MAVKYNTFVVDNIFTTNWYKPLYLPVNQRHHLLFSFD